MPVSIILGTVSNGLIQLLICIIFRSEDVWFLFSCTFNICNNSWVAMVLGSVIMKGSFFKIPEHSDGTTYIQRPVFMDWLACAHSLAHALNKRPVTLGHNNYYPAPWHDAACETASSGAADRRVFFFGWQWWGSRSQHSQFLCLARETWSQHT